MKRTGSSPGGTSRKAADDRPDPLLPTLTPEKHAEGTIPGTPYLISAGGRVRTYREVMAELSVQPIRVSDALSKNTVEFSQKTSIVSPQLKEARQDSSLAWILSGVIWQHLVEPVPKADPVPSISS